jgi:hypothetical protein
VKLFFTLSLGLYREEKSILINGLIWMGEPAFMKQQIEEKIS